MIELFDTTEASEQHVDVLKQVVERSKFPWARIDEKIIVLSRNMSMQFTGQWFSSGNRTENYPPRSLVLNDRMQENSIPFTVAHELGHAIDTLCLSRDSRAELTRLMHDVKVQLGHFNHDHPDAGHKSEIWHDGSNAYTSKLNEAFADHCVRAFFPEQWEGRYPRFVHWTDDLVTFRSLVLGAKMAEFTDVPDTHTHAEGIKWASEQGLIEGYPDRTFRPDQSVTRGQIATILKKALDK